VLHQVVRAALGGQRRGRVGADPADVVEQRHHLVHERLVPRLAALARDDLDQVLGPLGERVAQPPQAVRPLVDRQHGPGGLRLARARDDLLHLLVGRHGQLGEQLAAGGRERADGGGRTPELGALERELTHGELGYS
jgi:hypothetical protein